MTKTMTKLAVIGIVGLVVLILCIFAHVKFSDYSDYKENADIVNKYMQETHSNIRYELKKTIVGKNSWPADRVDDEFIYYDIDNEFYFRVTILGDDVTDYYYEAFYGQRIVSEFKTECNIDTNSCLMRAWAQKQSDDVYSDVSCQVVIFVNDAEVHSDAFEIYRYLNERYNDVEISFVFAKENARQKYEDLFKYENRVALSSLPHFFYCDIKTDKVHFLTLNEFINYIKTNNIP